MALGDVAHELLQPRPLHRTAREPSVVVSRFEGTPPLTSLREDVRLAGLPLRMQAVELLIEPLLGGLAGVDGAAEPFAHRRRSFSPKNTSPFHLVPVIRFATSDS